MYHEDKYINTLENYYLERWNMNFRRFQKIDSDVEQLGPTVAFVCPTCSNEIDLNEIVEERGNVRCINCK